MSLSKTARVNLWARGWCIARGFKSREKAKVKVEFVCHRLLSKRTPHDDAKIFPNPEV